MIRVTIEMVPLGLEDLKYPMHIIEIWNKVGLTLDNPQRGDYHYRISRKLRLTTKTVTWHKEGVVENFPRAAKNVVHLLLAILKDGYEK